MSEWISVKDRLPAACEEVVLLLCNPNREKESRLEIGYLDLVEENTYGHKNMFLFIIKNYDVTDELLLEDVTHWMPLPKRPEERGER